MMFTGFWLTSLTTLIDIFNCRTTLYISYPSPFLLSILLNVKNISHPMKHKLSADLYAHLLLCFLKHITLFPMLRSQHLVAVGFGVWAKTYHPDLVWCGLVTDNPLEHLQCCSRLLTKLSVVFPYPLHCLGCGLWHLFWHYIWNLLGFLPLVSKIHHILPSHCGYITACRRAEKLVQKPFI